MKLLVRSYSPHVNNIFHFYFDRLYEIYRHLLHCEALDQVALLVSREKGRFDSLYKIFAPKRISYQYTAHRILQRVGIQTDAIQVVDRRFHTPDAGVVGATEHLPDFRQFFISGMELEIPKHIEPRITLIKRRRVRSLVNHDQVVRGLARLRIPVEEHYLEDLPLVEQMRLMLRTSLLVAPHGAGNTNMLFMRSGTALIEINPYGWKPVLYREIGKALGIHYSSVSGLRDPTLYTRPATERIRSLEARHGEVTFETAEQELRTQSEVRYWVRDQNILVDRDQLVQLAEQEINAVVKSLPEGL